MVSLTTVVTVVCCCLLVAVPFAVAGAAQPNVSTGDRPDNATEGNSQTVDRCFPTDGYEFTIGTQGPKIQMTLYVSLLTNLSGPGAFGIELSGSTDGPPIIELRTGVISDGIDDVTSFINNPFEPFSIAFEYQFELPMFGDGFSHEESESPVSGPVGTANCKL